MIATVVPDYKQMASALKAAAGLLSNIHILSSEGVGSLNAAASRLHRYKDKSKSKSRGSRHEAMKPATAAMASLAYSHGQWEQFSVLQVAGRKPG